MEITLKDKVAVVTGGTRGIGYAIVKALVESGAKVAIWGSRQETSDAAMAKIKEQYPDCDVMAMAPKLTDAKEVEAAMNAVVEKYGRLDILANNAGIAQNIPLESYTDDDLDKIIDLNIKAVFICSKAAAHLMKGKGGSIINTKNQRWYEVSFFGENCYIPGGSVEEIPLTWMDQIKKFFRL